MVKNINKNIIILLMLSLGMLCARPNVEAAALKGDLNEDTSSSLIASIGGAVSHLTGVVAEGLSTSKKLYRNKHQSNIERHNLDQKRFWKLANKQLSENYPLPYLGDKEIILLLGETGVGKSTFINRMLGYEFYWESKGGLKGGEESDDDLAFMEDGYDNKNATGPRTLAMKENKDIRQRAHMSDNDATSGTKVPQVYALSKDLVLVDCPGFGDTGGKEQEILNMLMIRLLVEKSQKVNSVMCLISYEKSLGGAGKGQDFLYLARQLDYLLSFEDYMANIFWCFTRYPEDINRNYILERLEGVKKQKLLLRTEWIDNISIWHKSQEKKDYLLMEKVLQKKNRIMRISPFMTDQQVNGLKNFLAKKLKGCIKKEAFMFHYPALDIKSTTKELFEKKDEIRKAYEDKIRLKLTISEKKAKQRALAGILKDESKLEKYMADPTATVRQDIADVEKQIRDKETAIASKEAVTDDVKLYRTETVDLSASWLSDSKTITYNDLPFDRTEEFYNQDLIKRTSIVHDPDKGIYAAEFTAPGTIATVIEAVKGFWEGGQNSDIERTGRGAVGIDSETTVIFQTNNPAKVEVNFYVKNKYIQSSLVEKLKNSLKSLQQQLEALKAKKVSIKNKTIDDVKEQLENILPGEINECWKQIKQKEHVLQGQEMLLRFIVEVYPLLYPGVENELNDFATQHKDTFQLFAQPQSAVQNDGDDEKENDTHEDVQKYSREKPPIVSHSQANNNQTSTCQHGISLADECKECETDTHDMD